MQEPKTFIRRRDVARRWSVSVATIKRREKLGNLPHFKIGGAVRFDLQDIEAIEALARVPAQGGQTA
jgi:predicted DNA-binding transcriptional regulator AlpA